MLLKHRTRPLTTTVVAGAFALSALGLTACGGDTAGSEAGTDVADIQKESAPAAVVGPFNGVYDTAFYDRVQSYDGEKVTVSAKVNEVVSPTSFTIAGTEDTAVGPMLVVSATEVSGVKPDLAVSVTGTVHKAFDLPTVEKSMGVDLDDALYEPFDQEPYIEATKIDTSVPANQ